MIDLRRQPVERQRVADDDVVASTSAIVARALFVGALDAERQQRAVPHVLPRDRGGVRMGRERWMKHLAHLRDATRETPRCARPSPIGARARSSAPSRRDRIAVARRQSRMPPRMASRSITALANGVSRVAM